MPSPSVTFDVAPCDFDAVHLLASELGVSRTLAQVLARRGLADPVDARRFLAAADRHELHEFGGLDAAAKVIADHVERRSRITIHGDYDVDGVCSTAILVRVLRTLGAGVDWYLPSRTEDGYGLAAATVDRLAAVFGAPDRLTDHADRALAAALAIAELVRECFPGELEIGIGGNSGAVTAGSVGGGGRYEFTVIGDPVNTAARVEEATRTTGDAILVTDALRSRLRLLADFDWDERCDMELKGKAEALTLFAPRVPVASAP